LRRPALLGQLAEIEAAAVRSWPAPETADIDGWLWRYASGGSFRANSVSALSFRGASFEAAVREAERRYRAKGAPCLFTVADVSEPADIDERLAALGYARGEDHVTMVKAIAGAAHSLADVTLSADPPPDWLAVYLSGLSPNRREVAPAILARLPAHRAFFACRRSREVSGSGLSVADGPLASVQCMATLPSARRQGCARRCCPPLRPGPPLRTARTSTCRPSPRMRPPSPSTSASASTLPAATICVRSVELWAEPVRVCVSTSGLRYHGGST
jgi:N-acetylglutamate synthase